MITSVDVQMLQDGGWEIKLLFVEALCIFLVCNLLHCVMQIYDLDI